MAEVDVKKQSHERATESGALQRRGSYPSLLSLHPAELFGVSPFSLMRRFSEEMDRMFSGRGILRGSGSEALQWSPAVEVRERDGKLEVVADLPGIKESDVKVEVNDEGLVIQGERKQEHEEKGEGYYRSERSYGQFYRVIPLPEGANLDQARAEFHNGELRVSIPVPQQQRTTRQIPISAGPEKKEAASQAAAGAQQSRRAG